MGSASYPLLPWHCHPQRRATLPCLTLPQRYFAPPSRSGADLAYTRPALHQSNSRRSFEHASPKCTLLTVLPASVSAHSCHIRSCAQGFEPGLLGQCFARRVPPCLYHGLSPVRSEHRNKHVMRCDAGRGDAETGCSNPMRPYQMPAWHTQFPIAPFDKLHHIHTNPHTPTNAASDPFTSNLRRASWSARRRLRRLPHVISNTLLRHRTQARALTSFWCGSTIKPP